MATTIFITVTCRGAMFIRGLTCSLTLNHHDLVMSIRASVVNSCTEKYDLDATLKKLEHFTRLAKERDNTDIIVFPEAFIGGYPKMSTFDCVVGDRAMSGRDEFVRYYSSAMELPSPELSRIEAVSRETGVFIVAGIIERDSGTLYCTAIFVSPDAGYVGKHRKLVPTALERVIWGQGDGSTIPVLQQTFHPSKDERPVAAKLSAAICWENYMPLLRTHYYSRGTQIYCAPTVDSRPEWQNTMAHIAIEGRCFVLSACQFAQEKNYPDGHAVRNPENRDGENVMIGGGSVIYSPLGKVLAGPLGHEEGVLSATLDLGDCVRGKFDLDVVGHYARNDVFKLMVNEKSGF